MCIVKILHKCTTSVCVTVDGIYFANIKKTHNFDEKHKIINKNIKVVNLEILKVKTWFGDKDLFS